MDIFTSFTKALIISAVATAIMTAPSYAMMAEECLGTEDAKYPNISTTGGNGTDFPVYCQKVKIDDEYISLYGKTSADCTQAGKFATDPEACGDEDDYEEIDEEPMVDDEDEASKDVAATESNDSKETHMDDPTSPLLIVSLIANGLLLVAVIVLVILLTTKTANKSSDQDSSDTSTPSEPSEPTTSPTDPTAPTEPVTTTEPTAPTESTTPAEDNNEDL